MKFGELEIDGVLRHVSVNMDQALIVTGRGLRNIIAFFFA